MGEINLSFTTLVTLLPILYIVISILFGTLNMLFWYDYVWLFYSSILILILLGISLKEGA